jgi:hypothetical protein
MVRRRNIFEEGYKPYLCHLMAYRDEAPGDDYPRAMEWSHDQLLAITPDAIARYAKQLVYGTSTSGPNDMLTHCRVNTSGKVGAQIPHLPLGDD